MNPKMKNSLAFTLFFFIIFSVLFCCNLTSSLSVEKSICHPDDRKALSEIYEALGVSRPIVADQNCCKLHSVNCYLNPPYRVFSLSIFLIPVSGHIPAAIGDLPYLQALTFHHLPNLTGTIPHSIVKLTKLTYLDISMTGVSGPIPAFLAKLKNLDYLNLSHNNFTGSIPPELSQLNKMILLHLDRNKLTGTIPESFGLFAGSNPDIYLSHNQLSGPIPKSLTKLNNILLDLSRNNLTGDASFLLGKNTTSFRGMNLSRNDLMFDFSKVEFSESLISLDLNHNKVFGSLPQQLTQVESLAYLNVSYNRLCGEIPQGGKLQEFDMYSYFHNRCLCGAPLPPCTSSLQGRT